MVDEAPKRAKSLLLSALVGVGGGFLSGLFGVGGGILIVPGLVMLLRMQQRLAHGTSLAAIVPIAVAGLFGYAVEDAVDPMSALFLAVGGALGALVGTSLLRRLPERALRGSFALVLIASAVRLYIHIPDAQATMVLSVASAAGLLFVGFVSGVLAGLLGVGGGVVIVPALVLLFGVPLLTAKGTSLLVIIPTALSGTWKNLRHRQADLKAGAIVGTSGMLASLGGVAVATRLETRIAVILFGVLLVAVAIKTLFSKPKPKPGSSPSHPGADEGGAPS